MTSRSSLGETVDPRYNRLPFLLDQYGDIRRLLRPQRRRALSSLVRRALSALVGRALLFVAGLASQFL
jgi:hypothetical protein